VLRTRSPRARLLYCYRRLRVRLACVKHAASVRSEPGSNSRLKPSVSTAIALGYHDRNELLNRSVLIPLRELEAGLLKLPVASVHPKQQTKTKRVLACIIQLSKSRYSQASWKDEDEPRYYRSVLDVSRENLLKSKATLKVFCSRQNQLYRCRSREATSGLTLLICLVQGKASRNIRALRK
jgi:hypothetical protein